MSRRVSLPTADDLFRPTSPTVGEDAVPAPTPRSRAAEPAADQSGGADDAGAAEQPDAPAEPQGKERGTPRRKPSGRVRHDEKMTVYVTADELLDLEHARLTLRRATGLAVDRGRLVRAAVAIALADLDAHGEESMIVQRLKQP